MTKATTEESVVAEELHQIEDLQSSELLIGASSKDITPPLPVALGGQFHMRVADTNESPVTANVIVLERRGTNGTKETSVWVSADLVIVPDEL